MTERDAGSRQGEQRDGRQDGPDLQSLARDWITLWQSELAAMAVDREAQEAWQTMLAIWAGAAGTVLQSLPRAQPRDNPRDNPRDQPRDPGHDARGWNPGAAVAPGAAPAAAASDARDAEIDRLAGRIAELERRLAELERGGG